MITSWKSSDDSWRHWPAGGSWIWGLSASGSLGIPVHPPSLDLGGWSHPHYHTLPLHIGSTPLARGRAIGASRRRAYQRRRDESGGRARRRWWGGRRGRGGWEARRGRWRRWKLEPLVGRKSNKLEPNSREGSVAAKWWQNILTSFFIFLFIPIQLVMEMGWRAAHPSNQKCWRRHKCWVSPERRRIGRICHLSSLCLQTSSFHLCQHHLQPPATCHLPPEILSSPVLRSPPSTTASSTLKYLKPFTCRQKLFSSCFHKVFLLPPEFKLLPRWTVTGCLCLPRRRTFRYQWRFPPLIGSWLDFN